MQYKTTTYHLQAIIQASKDLIMPNGKLTKIRVGVHSGSVTSGVVGQKLPKFSLFGDTMNTVRCNTMQYVKMVHSLPVWCLMLVDGKMVTQVCLSGVSCW